MAQSPIRIQLLGAVELEKNNILIHDGDNRSKKLWILLGYLLFNRGQKVSNDKLISLMWEDEEISSNPSNALKTLFHRMRSTLDNLGDGTGKDLILCKRGEYYFNTFTNYTMDIEEFEGAITDAKNTNDINKKFSRYYKAFQLYGGDFMSKFSSEAWVVPISTYYHSLYLEVVEELLEICDKTGNHSTAVSICKKANTIERYEESFYYHLMKNLIRLEEYEDAVTLYHELADMLSSNFGVKPSDEVKELYREASHNTRKTVLDINELQQQLIEPPVQKRTALFCDYEVFTEIYHAMARSMERAGNIIHLTVINITDVNDQPLSKRSLLVASENLKLLICDLLRLGDIISMCSPSQFVIMLPNANRENSEMVMKRIIKAFFKQYPHSPAKLTYGVQPVLPPKHE